MHDDSAAPNASPHARAAFTPLPRRRRHGRWLALLALVAGVGATAAWLQQRPVEAQFTSVQRVRPAQQYAQLAASGYVVAQRRAAVASKATGRLVELRVSEGSRVKAGDLIARIDAADVDASLAASLAGQTQSQAAVQQAQAQAAQARAQQRNAEEELRRTEGLAAQNFMSAQAVDTARTRVQTARAATAAAEAGIATARAAVQQARAQVQVQRVNRDSTEIRAPFDGVVLVKNANVGDLITPFSNAAGTLGAVVTMADLSTLEVEVDVSESSIAGVRVDQPVEITLDALPGEHFKGAVSRIVPTVDRAKATVVTKVRFAQIDPRVLPEMSAKVNFLSQQPQSDQTADLLAVPAAALVPQGEGTGVWRVDAEGRAHAVAATAGRPIGELVELKASGLQAGDRLVLSSAAPLKEGARVRAAGTP
ncbi:efflux RND transporter periplasmic adaptor subunit [Piscinibacter sakaiensis]|uniref:efflux RND transporter periplasmic adaptor subunit n=1 Tax=Piscinibacter sakaiensis TaxID=1547922 RepID=UPI0009E9F64D|nr:efflux RND transporter periplasmic adaptor subunit [Piscinibacter sakaiensis]